MLPQREPNISPGIDDPRVNHPVDDVRDYRISGSENGSPVALCYGTNKVAGAQIDGIVSVVAQNGGTATHWRTWAISEGPILGVLRGWIDNKKKTLAELQAIFSIGVNGIGAGPWYGAMGNRPYLGTATIGVKQPGWNTGTAVEVPNLQLEVQGLFCTAVIQDANPADIIVDMFTHNRRGLGWSATKLDAGISSAAADSYRTYCDAKGFRVSLLVDKQKTVGEILQQLLQATNSRAIWSGSCLKVIPLGDQATTTPVYGSTNYVPSNTAVYNLGVDDFCDRERPVRVVRTAEEDVVNSVPVEWIERAHDYSVSTVANPDLAHIALVKETRRGDTISLGLTVRPETAVELSRIAAQRSINCRNEFSFELPAVYLLLEPGDIVTLTEPKLGLSLAPVRIKTIDEEINDDGTSQFAIVAEDWPAGVAAANSFTVQTRDGLVPDLSRTTQNVLTPQTPIAEANMGVGFGANLLFNGDFSSGVQGWFFTTTHWTPVYGVNVSANWTLGGDAATDKGGGNTLSMLHPGAPMGVPTNHVEIYAKKVPITGGATYMFDGLATCHRCPGQLAIAWWDANGVWLGTIQSDGTVGGVGTAGTVTGLTNGIIPDIAGVLLDGKTEDKYAKFSFKATAPANACFASPGFIQYDTKAGQTDGYLFAARCRLQQVQAMVNAPGPQANWSGSIAKTSNYTEDGSGNPTAGAKLDNVGIALKVAPGQFQIGTRVFTDQWFKLLQAIDGTDASSTVIWRGNNDGGGPGSMDCLALYNRAGHQLVAGRNLWNVTLTVYRWWYANNTDGIFKAKILWYNSSGTYVSDSYHALAPPGFVYRGGNGQGDGNAENASSTEISVTRIGSSLLHATTPNMFIGYARVTLYNQHGYLTRDYGPGPNVEGGQWPSANVVIPGQGAPPGGGGGGGIDPNCPAPWMKVQLASGLLVNAIDLVPGTQVVGVDDRGMPAVGVIDRKRLATNMRQEVALANGKVLDFSNNHRLALAVGGWKVVGQLRPGDLLAGLDGPVAVKALGKVRQAQVVDFQVKGCQTYFAEGILCHNRKPL